MCIRDRLSPIHIFGAVPSAVLAFVMCVAILENEFRTAVIISGICAVVMGAIGGRNFTEITLFYAYSSIIVFAARKRPRYVGNFPKTIVWTFIMSAILEILLFVIREMTLDVSVIFSDALPTAVDVYKRQCLDLSMMIGIKDFCQYTVKKLSPEKTTAQHIWFLNSFRFSFCGQLPLWFWVCSA